MSTWNLEEIVSRVTATSDHSVTVYDRPHTEQGAEVIGTVNSGPSGVEAYRVHYSLAGRASARVPGEFQTIGDGAVALIADYDSGRRYPVA